MLSEKTGMNLLIDQGMNLNAKLTNGSEVVGVRLMGEQVRYSLRFKPEDLGAVQKASQLHLPAKIGTSSTMNGNTILCLGPDEWLLISDLANKVKLKQTFAKLADKFIFSAVDISHRNLGFSVSGPHAQNLLNMGCPLDFSLRAFPDGKCTRTVFETVEIILLRNSVHEFHVEVWRSFAPNLYRFFEKFIMDGTKT